MRLHRLLLDSLAFLFFVVLALFLVLCILSLRLFCFGLLHRQINLAHDFGSLQFLHAGLDVLGHSHFRSSGFLRLLRLVVSLGSFHCGFARFLSALFDFLFSFAFLDFLYWSGLCLFGFFFGRFFALLVQTVQVNLAHSDNMVGDILHLGLDMLHFLCRLGCLLWSGSFHNCCSFLFLGLGGRCFFGRRFFLGFDIDFADDLGFDGFHRNFNGLGFDHIGNLDDHIISGSFLFRGLLGACGRIHILFFLESADFNFLGLFLNEFLP